MCNYLTLGLSQLLKNVAIICGHSNINVKEIYFEILTHSFVLVFSGTLYNIQILNILPHAGLVRLVTLSASLGASMQQMATGHGWYHLKDQVANIFVGQLLLVISGSLQLHTARKLSVCDL